MYVYPKCTIIHIFCIEVEGLGTQRSGIFRNRDEPCWLTWAELSLWRYEEGRACTEIATVFGFKQKDYFLFIQY